MKNKEKQTLTGMTDRCPNCGEIITISKLNPWEGYKIKEGHVFCKMCSHEIK
jgi:rRNA maturation protein Nop10